MTEMQEVLLRMGLAVLFVALVAAALLLPFGSQSQTASDHVVPVREQLLAGLVPVAASAVLILGSAILAFGFAGVVIGISRLFGRVGHWIDSALGDLFAALPVAGLSIVTIGAAYGMFDFPRVIDVAPETLAAVVALALWMTPWAASSVWRGIRSSDKPRGSPVPDLATGLGALMLVETLSGYDGIGAVLTGALISTPDWEDRLVVVVVSSALLTCWLLDQAWSRALQARG